MRAEGVPPSCVMEHTTALRLIHNPLDVPGVQSSHAAYFLVGRALAGEPAPQ